jgi:hypothetical protein
LHALHFSGKREASSSGDRFASVSAKAGHLEIMPRRRGLIVIRQNLNVPRAFPTN